MKYKLVILVAALVCVCAACSPDTAGSDAEAADKVTASPPGHPSLVVGSVATTTEAGNKLTVISYRAPISLEGASPDPGSEFSVIEVEGCASSSSGRDLMHVGPTAFSLRLPDGTSVKPEVFADADATVKEPALQTMDPKPGTCDRGFVTFQTPRGASPELVVFEEQFVDATDLAWRVR